jgi:hypothetical protein
MTSIAGWLIALCGPLVVRAIIALGFTAVTYTGVKAAADALISTAQSNWSGLPVTVMQLASLTGIPEGLGMVFGAMMAVFAAKVAAGFGKYVFKGSGS